MSRALFPNNCLSLFFPFLCSDLDVFFRGMYHYFQHRGFATIVTGGVTNVLTLGFTVVFSSFLFSWVDWSLLSKCRDENSCQPASAYLRNPLRNPSFMDVMVFIWSLLFTAYWAWTVAGAVHEAREAADMGRLFEKLGISAKDLITVEWNVVVTRLEALHKSGRYTVAINSPAGFTARDIACRIMRKENYLIAMLNKVDSPQLFVCVFSF